jgi:hypothetical protein
MRNSSTSAIGRTTGRRASTSARSSPRSTRSSSRGARPAAVHARRGTAGRRRMLCKDAARAARKHAGVPTARNGPPERIPTCDWDAGVSEHAKEKDRMFVRGLLTPEAEGWRSSGLRICSLAILLYVVELWHMALTTGVDVAARPGGVGALGSFAVDAGRFGDAGTGRADRRGRRRNGPPRVWMADRARECGLVLQADAFPASPENATQAPQDRMALRRSQPAWSAAPIPHDRLPPASATDPAARRERPRPRVRRNTAVDRHHRGPRYAPAGLIEYLDAGGPVIPVAPARHRATAAPPPARTRPCQQARARAV